MKGIMNPHQPNPPVFPNILRRVSALEAGYGRALTVSRDVRGVMNTLLQLEKNHRRLQSCLKSFQKNPALVSAHFINNGGLVRPGGPVSV